jgi:hypothetical protein
MAGDDSQSSNMLKRKLDDDMQDKKYFCFHESCEQKYNSEKLLGNHIRNTHKDRWPDLPGTCDHDGNVKKFRTWEECLTHLTYHQRAMGMRRKDYDKIHASAQFWLSYSNQRVGRDDPVFRIDSPIGSLIPSPASNQGYPVAWDSTGNPFGMSNLTRSVSQSPTSNSGNPMQLDFTATDNYHVDFGL